MSLNMLSPLTEDRDGIKYHDQWCSRWQKHDKDRIYFNDGERESWDGHVDLEDGSVVGDTPIETVEVNYGRVEYLASDGSEIVSRPL